MLNWAIDTTYTKRAIHRFRSIGAVKCAVGLRHPIFHDTLTSLQCLLSRAHIVDGIKSCGPEAGLSTYNKLLKMPRANSAEELTKTIAKNFL